MSLYITEKHLMPAEKFVERAHANGGLAPIDLDRFWADQGKAISDPWAADCPQVPLGLFMTPECIFEELGIPVNNENWYRVNHDAKWLSELSRKYNDIAERIVGRRQLFSEAVPDPSKKWPEIKGPLEIFEGRNEWHVHSYWQLQSANNEDELKALLDRVEERLEKLREFIFPPNWQTEKTRLTAAGARPPLLRSLRGPMTLATSIYGVENLIYLINDNPDLAARYRDLILAVILEAARVQDEEAGFTPETAPHGWWWADDNCYLLTPDMYEFFGYPILKGVFNRYSPNPKDVRGQHSDSSMAHLLPILSRLNFTWVNFGPTLTVSEIRAAMPNTLIQGQLAPYTFSRNEEVNIVAEFLRDFEMARECKGLVFTTAGSINHGSRLSGMRLVMAAIQEFGQY